MKKIIDIMADVLVIITLIIGMFLVHTWIERSRECRLHSSYGTSFMTQSYDKDGSTTAISKSIECTKKY